mgnify:CR=1 FL=1
MRDIIKRQIRIWKGCVLVKKLYNFLNILMWCVIGAFVGTSIYTYYEYCRYPGLYEMRSAPWYLSVEVNAIFAAIVVVVILVIRALLKRKLK